MNKAPVAAVVLSLATVFCMHCPLSIGAERYPDRPIRMIVPYVAGGGVDFFARILARKLSDLLRQQVVIDNRPGGGANIGADLAARSAPDGYTLFVTNIAFAVNPSFTDKMPFDPQKDFSGVSQIATLANCLVVHPAVPAKSVTELLDLARKRPGQLNYGSAGNGSSTHLAAELFKGLAAVDIVHVPYRGAADAVVAIVGGQVQSMFASLPSVLPHVRANRLRALGVTGSTRSRAAPELPTVAEAGLPGFEMSSWIGIMTRSGTPPQIIAVLNRAVGEALRSPEVADGYAREGGEAVGSTPEQFESYVHAEIVKWGKIVKQAGIRPD
jgi:tripartite-type tricarboxylate transporter receptor subunit TctC